MRFATRETKFKGLMRVIWRISAVVDDRSGSVNIALDIQIPNNIHVSFYRDTVCDDVD